MTQLHALGLTLLIEGLVGVALLALWLRLRGRTLLRGAAVVLAASLLTHPAAWRANRIWLHFLPFTTRAAVIEAAVVVVEAVILTVALRAVARDPSRPIAAWRCAVVSLLMNAASFGYGLWRLG